jgi:transcription elongation factor GreA
MIAEAKAEGDISENAGYDEAKTAQGFLEGRIRELEVILKNAQVIRDTAAAPDIVMIGRTVVVREQDADTEEEYTIVGPPEADPGQGGASATKARWDAPCSTSASASRPLSSRPAARSSSIS